MGLQYKEDLAQSKDILKEEMTTRLYIYKNDPEKLAMQKVEGTIIWNNILEYIWPGTLYIEG
jgi:hypothetical protein